LTFLALNGEPTRHQFLIVAAVLKRDRTGPRFFRTKTATNTGCWCDYRWKKMLSKCQ